MNNSLEGVDRGNATVPLAPFSRITLTINSATKRLEVQPWTTLLDLLRETLV